MPRQSLWGFGIWVWAGCMGAGAGVQAGPLPEPQRPVFFSLSDQNPLLRSLAWAPVSVRPRPRAGRWQWHVEGQVTNHSRTAAVGGETLSLDGESDVLSLAGRYGWSAEWYFGAAVTLVSHRAGRLDGLIARWHEIWGLSNGDRNGPHNRLALRYTNRRGETIGLTRPVTGLGDVRLSVERDLSGVLPRGAAVGVAGVELPTGDADRLLGNGATDLFAALAWEGQVKAYRIGVRFGVTGVKFRAVITPERSWVPYAAVAVNGRPWRRWTPRVQLDFHGAVVASELEELSASATWLSVGFAYAFSEKVTFEGALVEDLFSDTVPDFGLYGRWLIVP